MSNLFSVVAVLAILSGPLFAVDGREKQTPDRYQQALNLLQSARTIRNADDRNKQIDRAQKVLEQLVTKNGKHPQFAQANAQLAQILLGKARVLLWHSESATDADRKMQDRQQARKLLRNARTYFQVAHDLSKKQFNEFPVFIDRQTDPDKFAARRSAEIAFIRAQLDLALCDFEEGHTYEETDPKFKTFLGNAAAAFEKIHNKYRSLVVGLYARLYQAKCFQETGEVRKALGIYNKLLSHPAGSSTTMQTLQDQARQFRLICLNHDQRKDYVLAIGEAENWLETAKERSQTTTGLGIRWELALAQEQRSKQTDVPEAERKQLLQRALENARLIARFTGRYKAKTLAMIARLSTADE